MDLDWRGEIGIRNLAHYDPHASHYGEIEMKTEEIKLKFLESGVGYFEAKIEKDGRILAILIIYSTHKRNTWHLKIYPH